jgi:alpha-galactosidase
MESRWEAAKHLGFALMAFSSAVAVAADPDPDSTTTGLEEITVTATRHAEPAERVPVSMNVFNDRMLTDLLSYAPGDQQPSVFLLKENARQAILTVFNWTEQSRPRAINLAQLGLKDPGQYKIVDTFGEEGCCDVSSGTLNLTQKPHSVRIIKLIDNSVPSIPPPFEVRSPTGATAGETLVFRALAFKADSGSPEAPVLASHWDFGDGTSLDGTEVRHAYTTSGEYPVTVTVTGLDSVTNRKTLTVTISGNISTRFDPSQNRRAE